MNDDSFPRLSLNSSCYTVWNDFENSYSSELYPESPAMSMPMPTCQPTPLTNREEIMFHSGKTGQGDFLSPVAKRRKLCSLYSPHSSLCNDSTENVDFNDFETDSEESLTLTPQESTPANTQCSSQQSNASNFLVCHAVQVVVLSD